MSSNTSRCMLLALFAMGCGKSGGSPTIAPSDATATRTRAADAATKPATKPDGDFSCDRQPFASKIPIAEASGATWMPDSTLLVIGDSGTNGAFLRLSSADGSVLTKGNLPLDSGASDDLEGLSRIGSTVYGITSSGYMREWQQSGDTFTLTRKSYSVTTKGDTEYACESARDSNCGPNYEGLCLLDTPESAKPTSPETAPCVGYAAAKARGELVCLTRAKNGRLKVRPSHKYSVAGPKTLSGCHFDTQGKLWFGNNVFAANSVGVIEEHERPESAEITRIGALGLGFAEAIAVGTEGQVFRFSDTTGSPSLLDKYICR